MAGLCGILPRMRFLLFSGCLVLSLVACAQDSDAVLRGKVIRVMDGDTAEVKLQSGAITVRFYGIDAPERDQPHGKAAGLALRQLIVGKEVDLLPVEQDKYDLILQEAIFAGPRVDITDKVIKALNSAAPAPR